MKKLTTMLAFLLLATFGVVTAQDFSNPNFVPYRMMFKERSAADITSLGTPPSGYGFMYQKDDNLWYIKDDAGTEINIAGGVGSFTSLTVDNITLNDSTISTATDKLFVDIAKASGTIVDFKNSGAGSMTLYVDGAQLDTDDLSDVTSMAMLDENETVTGAWSHKLDNAAAFTVEKADGTDIFVVDTSTPKVTSTAQLSISTTDQDGIVFGSLGTATKGIDLSSAGLSGSGDYWLYNNASNYWKASGSINISGVATIGSDLVLSVLGGSSWIDLNGFNINDDKPIKFGTSGDGQFLWETADADAHYLSLALTTASRNFIISEDVGIDWTHATQTNPTLWIQSVDATNVNQYISFAHDQTDGVITTGAGDLKLSPASELVVLDATKATTGDPTGVEGGIYINTFDNAIRMYADGAWRTLASW